MQVIQFIVLLLFISSGMAQDSWQSLAPGMDLGTFAVSRPSRTADSRITVLRIDPQRWSLELVGIDDSDDASGQSARSWSKSHDLTATINAGMFAADYRTHVGYLRTRDKVRNPQANYYQSVAAFDSRREGVPRFRIFDLDSPGVSLDKIHEDYASAVQNLRLIKRPGQNRWRQQEKRWSEAALGEDGAGRILFIFCRTPYSMHDFNNVLLNLGIDLVAAQHLEGGAQAQLYIDAGAKVIELTGRQRSAFDEEHGISLAWPIPYVLGVRPRQTPAD